MARWGISGRREHHPAALHSRDRLPTEPYDLGEHSSAQIATALNHLDTAEVTGSLVPRLPPLPYPGRVADMKRAE
ncbi:hypothetical protein GCM10009602_31490 [Nocardiopsis tropica]